MGVTVTAQHLRGTAPVTRAASEVHCQEVGLFRLGGVPNHLGPRPACLVHQPPSGSPPGARTRQPTMKRHLLASAVLALSGLLGSPAVSADQGAQRYQVKTSFSDIKAGGARTDVRAPLDVVSRAVVDFGNYAEHINKFEKARVVGRHGDSTDVYLQVPILKGTAKVWAVVRFEAAKQTGDGQQVIVGRLIKGNVKRLDAKWHLSKIDDANTRMDLELLIVPDLMIPVPGSLVTGELAYAAEKAVVGMRRHSEKLNALPR